MLCLCFFRLLFFVLLLLDLPFIRLLWSSGVLSSLVSLIFNKLARFMLIASI